MHSFAHAPNDSIQQLGSGVFRAACRFDFSAPGFACIDLGPSLSPRQLRSTMVQLKECLSAEMLRTAGRKLAYLSMGRFDQQVTTKFHLDGAPEESVLILGYEPSVIRSRLFMGDYSRCAAEIGLSPRQFLDEHNPMFSSGAEKLKPYVTEVSNLNNRHFQIVVINNSSAPHFESNPKMQGVMHMAQIVDPSPQHSRIVNSTMTYAGGSTDAETISKSDQAAFIESESISRSRYVP